MQRAMQLQRHKGLKRRMRNYGDQWFEYLGGDINLLNKTAKLILTLKERHSRDSKKDGYTKQVRNLFRELEPLVEGGAFLSIIKDGRDNIPESLIRKMIKHFACHKHTSDSRRKIFKPFEAVRARRQTRRQRQEHLERLGVRTSSNSPTRRVPTNVFIAGTAQSGKSTILNQIRLIGKQGLLRDMYRGKWVDSICRNFTNLLFHARRLSSQGLVSMGRRSSESSWDEEGYRLVTTNGSEVELQNSVSLLSIEKMLHSESRTKDLTLLTAAKSAVLEVFSLDRKRREELQKTFTGSMNNIRAAKLNIEKIQNRRKEIISKSIIPKEIVKNWVSETLRWRFWVSPNLEGDVKKVEAFIADRIIGSTEVPKEITLSMDRLFHSPAIQRTLENRAEFQRNRLEPNVKYVLRKVRELGAQKRFVPSEQDILKIPARISDKTKIAAAMKVHSHVYTFQTLPQEGGSYGTKDVLLFVCDLEGFDHMLEHGRTSGLRDSAAKIQEEKRMTCKLKHQIEVFRELCEDETFKATSKVVALNKLDIFRKRIKQVPLSTIFPEFTGNPGDAEAAITFLCNQFVIVGKESRGHGMRRRTTQSTTPSMHSQASVMTTSRPSNPQNDIDSPRKRAMSSVEVVGLTATNRNSVVGILRRIIKSLD
uniref:G domain-containing protein n=1 Tax=Amorphochlora amoebiformis TaxID=1561963 RepID=A0A7S0GQ72_9EUKA